MLLPDRDLLLAQVAGDQELAVGLQHLRAIVEDDLAVREHVPAVRDLERELDVLLDEQHAAARVERVLVHDRQQALDDHGGEPERELVEEEQAGPAGEPARDREHLLLAAREEPDAPCAQLSELREVLVRRVLVRPLAAVSEPEVLGDGQAVEEPAALGDVHDPEPRPLCGRDAREVSPGECDAPAHRTDQPRDHSQRRRLAGAVGTEQRDHLARPDGQVEVADHGRPVVAGGQPLDAQQRVAS